MGRRQRAGGRACTGTRRGWNGSAPGARSHSSTTTPNATAPCTTPATKARSTSSGRPVSRWAPVRSTTVDPLAGLDVRRVVATGGSQSAMRLVTYINAFHRDSPVFDAFLLSVWEGRAPRPEEGAIAMGVRTAIRTDVDTPIVVVNSEFEASHLIGLDVEDTEHLRIWEVAGAPHGVARTGDDRPGRGVAGSSTASASSRSTKPRCAASTTGSRRAHRCRHSRAWRSTTAARRRFGATTTATRSEGSGSRSSKRRRARTGRGRSAPGGRRCSAPRGRSPTTSCASGIPAARCTRSAGAPRSSGSSPPARFARRGRPGDVRPGRRGAPPRRLSGRRGA